MQRHSNGRSSIGFDSQLIAASWLCYMCICAFYSLTEVKIWGNRALVRRNTYQESATWYGLQVAKLTVPLSYNFLTMTDKNIWKNTMFYKFLGRLIVLTPLGQGFSASSQFSFSSPSLPQHSGCTVKSRTSVASETYSMTTRKTDRAALPPAQHPGAKAEPSLTAKSKAQVDRLSVSQPVLSHRLPPLRHQNGTQTGQRIPLLQPSHLPTNKTPRLPHHHSLLLPASTNPSRSGRPEPRRRPIVDDDADSDPNFFESFANRVKNTFETNDFSISRPKWLGGDDSEDDSGRRRAGMGRGARDGEEGRTNGFMSLFGGRAEEGRVRL